MSRTSLKDQLAIASSHVHSLSVQLDTTRKSLSETVAIANKRGEDIAAFKAEVLALTTQVAEMRGYLTRTLEDDAVREIGATIETPPNIVPEQVQYQMPPQRVRSGPCAAPTIIGYGDLGNLSDHASYRNAQREQNRQLRSWLDR